MANDPHYGPPDAFAAPRYTGIRTFARCPHSTDPEGVDVAVVGVPFDTATSMRPGARFGPAAIRDGSLLLRPWHPATRSTCSRRCRSSTAATSTYARQRRADRRPDRRALGRSLAAGTIPLVLGGDHSIVLGELRAHAARHGPLGARAARRPRRHVGGVLRRALLPRHAVQARARGGADRPAALAAGRDARPAVRGGRPRRAALVGLRDRPLRGAADVDARPSTARGCASGSATARRTCRFDIDVHRPGVRARHRDARGRRAAAPRGDRVPARARGRARSRGFDVVEVSPPYDGPGTGDRALTGASIAYELLALAAVAAAGR